MLNLFPAIIVLAALVASATIAIVTIPGIDDVTAQGTNMTGPINMTNTTNAESGNISGFSGLGR
jgi:hypothetical protein